MFHRNTKKLESFIGSGSFLRGDIDSKGTLRIDGQLEGNITADWVILGEHSSVNGNVIARGVVIGGQLTGTIEAKEIVEIEVKGRVTGDIQAAKLTIAEGGLFDGRSSMSKHEDNVIHLQSQSCES